MHYKCCLVCINCRINFALEHNRSRRPFCWCFCPIYENIKRTITIVHPTLKSFSLLHKFHIYIYSFISITQFDNDHSADLNYPFFWGANGSGAVDVGRIWLGRRWRGGDVGAQLTGRKWLGRRWRGAVDRAQKTQDGLLWLNGWKGGIAPLVTKTKRERRSALSAASFKIL